MSFVPSAGPKQPTATGAGRTEARRTSIPVKPRGANTLKKKPNKNEIAAGWPVMKAKRGSRGRAAAGAPFQGEAGAARERTRQHTPASERQAAIGVRVCS